MKKLIILFVFVLFLGLNFTSCSSSDNDSSSTSLIVGKWNFSKFQVTEGGVTTPEMDYPNTPNCPKNYVEFKTGGVCNAGTYEGSTCILDIDPATWALSGSTIAITDGTDVSTLELVSVTSSTLKVKQTETENGVTYILNITFTKA
ncbi:MAG: hypothetical protein EXR18_05365 [Flavobacteriaceae bacterium]|nr:hypothetical protein [Flavobacteriaceae bacterium]